MSLFLQTAILSAGITCGSFEISEGPNYSLSEWSSVLCRRFESRFEETNLEKISSTQFSSEAKTSDLGSFETGTLRNGRVKLNWVSVDKKSKATLWVKVVGYQQTWVFTRHLAKGDEIKKKHLRKKRVNIAGLRAVQSLPTIDPSKGFAAYRNVRAGQVVTSDLIHPSPIIRRSDRIELVYQSNALTIRSKATALGTAWEKGDEIFVKTHKSTGPIRARAIGENRAIVF